MLRWAATDLYTYASLQRLTESHACMHRLIHEHKLIVPTMTLQLKMSLIRYEITASASEFRLFSYTQEQISQFNKTCDFHCAWISNCQIITYQVWKHTRNMVINLSWSVSFIWRASTSFLQFYRSQAGKQWYSGWPQCYSMTWWHRFCNNVCF